MKMKKRKRTVRGRNQRRTNGSVKRTMMIMMQ